MVAKNWEQPGGQQQESEQVQILSFKFYVAFESITLSVHIGTWINLKI